MTQSLLKQFDQLRDTIPGGNLFVTGADTDAGKTVFSWQLVKYLRGLGLTAIVFKPVECGDPGEKDSDFYRHHLGEESCICPYSFDRPVSPHYEARRTGVTIDFETIISCYQDLRERYDWVIVEGAGGVFCPLGDNLFMVDLIAEMNLPTVVVAKNMVGCLNHTLLSVESLRSRGIPLAGVVLNGRENRDNIADIPHLAKTPLLAVLPQFTIIPPES